MEELRLIVQTVANLPTLTIWVLCGYLVYKLAVIGSVYGLIRYAIEKFVEWRTKPVKYKIGAAVINEDVAAMLSVQINRLCSTSYIHSRDVIKLRDALDYIEQQEKKK